MDYYLLLGDRLFWLTNCKYSSTKKGARSRTPLKSSNHSFHNNFSIFLLALSITCVSKEARYICVVLSESCPIPSLITDIGIPSSLAILAHEWRATYIVKGKVKPNSLPIAFRLWFYKRQSIVILLSSIAGWFLYNRKKKWRTQWRVLINNALHTIFPTDWE